MLSLSSFSPSSTLIQTLRASAGRVMSTEERFEQRVSWVFGQAGGGLSKEDVRRQVRGLQGCPDFVAPFAAEAPCRP